MKFSPGERTVICSAIQGGLRRLMIGGGLRRLMIGGGLRRLMIGGGLRRLMIGGGPRRLMIGGGPRRLMIGGGPRRLMIGGGPRRLMIGGGPRRLMIGGGPRRLMIGGGPRRLMIGGGPRRLMIGGRPRRLMIGGGPRRLMIGGGLRRLMIGGGLRRLMIGGRPRRLMIGGGPRRLMIGGGLRRLMIGGGLKRLMIGGGPSIYPMCLVLQLSSIELYEDVLQYHIPPVDRCGTVVWALNHGIPLKINRFIQIKGYSWNYLQQAIKEAQNVVLTLTRSGLHRLCGDITMEYVTLHFQWQICNYSIYLSKGMIHISDTPESPEVSLTSSPVPAPGLCGALGRQNPSGLLFIRLPRARTF
ncbi:uncharacterized protein [Phyllobates terribilis]|uniref:uncharacterized protein isoform X1 n=2 Tax=Phyllobates terribilis TaxID=111132 RepID=UPI003CCB5919